MNSSSANNVAPSRLPYRLATVLMCAVFPLIWVGGLVTSSGAGMAVPDWPSTYGYNLFLYPWQTWILGPWDIFVEHGHRLLGAAIGLLTIAVALVAYRYESRAWIRRLAYLAVPLVVFQGVLGGLRVVLAKETLAMIHGCTGPLFFAYCVALWHYLTPPKVVLANAIPSAAEYASLRKLSRLAIVTTVLAYLQLTLGAVVRHAPDIAPGAAPSFFGMAVLFHLFMAAVLTVHIVQVSNRSYVAASKYGETGLLVPASWLIDAIVVQILLGVSTWIFNYGLPAFAAGWSLAPSFVVSAQSVAQRAITTAHVAVGSFILAVSTLLSLRARDAYLSRAAAAGKSPARAGSLIGDSSAILFGGLLVRGGAL